MTAGLSLLAGSPARHLADADSSLPGSDGRPRRTIYLHPGEVHAAAEPTTIVTVLGSCVSVCIFDTGAGVGGMNHYLLPYSAVESSPRFGAVAIAQLLRQVEARGASPRALQAKVFGGGSSPRMRVGGRNLGAENVALALHLLAEARIPIVDQDVGGTRGRKVVFHADAGAAWVRCL